MYNTSILSPKQLNPTVATMMVVLSTICFGLVPLFAKAMSNAGLASQAIVFYRYLLAALLLLPVLIRACKKGEAGKNAREAGKCARLAIFWPMSAGLAGGLGWIPYLEALKSAPVATVERYTDKQKQPAKPRKVPIDGGIPALALVIFQNNSF